jgi:hypothetical protein
MGDHKEMTTMTQGIGGCGGSSMDQMIAQMMQNMENEGHGTQGTGGTGGAQNQVAGACEPVDPLAQMEHGMEGKVMEEAVATGGPPPSLAQQLRSEEQQSGLDACFAIRA